MTDNTWNPGNFANRPQEEVQKIAQKGGLASHKNDKPSHKEDTGRAPDGKFEPGSEAAKEAGRKGGQASAKE